MEKLGETGTTFLSMPPAFQNIEDKCFGYAVDRQLAKVMEKTKSVAVWADMDSVDARYYGYMAAMLRSPYFLSSLSESDKLAPTSAAPDSLESAIASRIYAAASCFCAIIA